MLALLLLAPSFLRSRLLLFRTFGPGLRLIGRRAICFRTIVWRRRVPAIVVGPAAILKLAPADIDGGEMLVRGA